MGEIHVFVSQATNGVNNSIVIDGTPNAACTHNVFFFLEVEEYNPFGIERPQNATATAQSGTYQQPIYVDPMTGTLIPAGNA